MQTTNPLKLRFRRNLNKSKKQVGHISAEAEKQLERNFIRRLNSLVGVRRFVISWILLLVLLIGCVAVQTRALSGYYQTLQPVPGGIYVEGIVGSFTNANPIYASQQVDDSVSALMFSGLFKYNDKSQLVGDLAQSWSVDSAGTTYTVKLKPNLKWQDGKPLTAKDVVFTYNVIQNPDAQSPLNASWQDVGISAPDNQTVVFKLPNPLSPFPYSLTNGIIPQHILGNIPMDQMRSAPFNTTDPIGSGPFALKSIQAVNENSTGAPEQQATFVPSDYYYAGKPKLDSFIVRSFPTQQLMEASFKKQELNAMVGLSALSGNLANDKSIQSYNMPLAAETMVFFRTSSGVLSDVKVRRALVEGANVPQIISGLGYSAIPVNEPLLESQLGYNSRYQQSSSNVALAKKQLDADGWKVGKDGTRYKHGQPLRFSMYAQNSAEYTTITNELQKQWAPLGVDVQVYLQDTTDLQTTVAYHSYDALLYGISVGVDPDVFVYWDSSQADVRSQTRLNFSEYKSAAADAALEAGRTRSDPTLRAIKYQPFLQAWQQDSPALGLYQPRLLYVTRGEVSGLREHTLSSDVALYDNVQNWTIRQSLR